MEKKISMKIGDLIVLWLSGCLGNYIGEIIEEKDEHITVKVMEHGPFSNIKDYEMIIMEDETRLLQEDEKNNTSNYYIEEEKYFRRTMTGLKRLGIENGRLKYVYSSKEAKIKLEEYFKNKGICKICNEFRDFRNEHDICYLCQEREECNEIIEEKDK